jgi:hypothetical protein
LEVDPTKNESLALVVSAAARVEDPEAPSQQLSLLTAA